VETEDHIFREVDLRRYGGDDGPIYVAYQGIVYDVTASRRWHDGFHEGQHFAGQDLSAEMSAAPHSDDVLKRLGIHKVGRLLAETDSQS
jgi:predicted heme/steroid binding protein